MITVPFCFNLWKKVREKNLFTVIKYKFLVSICYHVFFSWLPRSNATDEELGEMTKTTNPDEINIDSDFSSDEDENVEGMWSLYMKYKTNKSNRSLTLVAAEDAIVWGLDLHLDLLCNKFRSPLKSWVRFLSKARCTWYNLMW